MGHLSGGPPLRVHALGSPPSRRARGFPGARALELGPGLAGAGGEARGGRHAPAMGTRDDRRRRGDAGRALARSLARRAVARALRAQGAAMSVRVLHAITRLTLGGSSENTIASCVALARAGYECSLTASFRESDASSLADARRRGCRLVDIPALGREVAPLADLIALAQLIHLIRRERPSIVHTHTSKAGFIGRLAAVTGPLPAVIHQPHGHIFYGYYRPRRTAVFTALERRAAHWTDRIITLTDRGSVEHLARGIGRAAQYVAVPSGVPTAELRAAAPTRAEARARLGLDPGELVVVGLGRLVPIKGFDLLVRALPSVIAQIPSARVLLVGDGAERARLDAIARSLGVIERLRMTGETADVTTYLAAADVVAGPARNRGGGRVVGRARAPRVPG